MKPGPSEPPYPTPNLAVSATVNKTATQVLLARQSPGLIAGIVEVDLQVPPGTASGNTDVVVSVGSYQTQAVGTTIAVQERPMDRVPATRR